MAEQKVARLGPTDAERKSGQVVQLAAHWPLIGRVSALANTRLRLVAVAVVVVVAAGGCLSLATATRVRARARG